MANDNEQKTQSENKLPQAVLTAEEHDPLEGVRRAVAVELAELCSEQLRELGHDGDVVEEIERELVNTLVCAGSPLEPLEAACEKALRDEISKVERERDEARKIVDNARAAYANADATERAVLVAAKACREAADNNARALARVAFDAASNAHDAAMIAVEAAFVPLRAGVRR